MAESSETAKDYRWAMAILGALLTAPAIISLIQNGFSIELHWGLSHFVEFYRGVFAPIIDIVQWPIRQLLNWLQVDWVIPQWMKDLHTLSFVLAALFVRGAMRNWREGENIDVLIDPQGVAPPDGPRARAIWAIGFALLLGASGFGVILFMAITGVLPILIGGAIFGVSLIFTEWTRVGIGLVGALIALSGMVEFVAQVWDLEPRPVNSFSPAWYERIILRRYLFRSVALTSAICAVAVIAFYLINGVLLSIE